MRLAHINIAGRGETDRFLASVVSRLEVAGLRLAGTVQTNIARADRMRCDMDLRVLPDGPVYRISEDRGAAARGCLRTLGRHVGICCGQGHLSYPSVPGLLVQSLTSVYQAKAQPEAFYL